MQENLLGYLLGALDGDERDDIQKRLEYDPQLREQLLELESQLIPLEQERWQHEPPAGLAAATCKFVAEHSEPSSKVQLEASDSAYAAVNKTKTSTASRRSGLRQLSEWNPRKHGWDFLDAAIAAGIFAAAAMLFFPAIANSRDQARLAACQDNLRLGTVGLSVFGERNGVLPYIPTFGNTGVAGFYAPQLKEGGFLNEDGRFLCPSSNLASCEGGSFRVPSAKEIRSATGPRLMMLQKKMGGSYMYTLGHFHRGRHYATVNQGRNFFPVMADATMDCEGKQQSTHGDGGVNVAFEGGHVRHIVGLSLNHPFFVSDRGVIEAGSHDQDAVLGHSWSRPQPLASEGENIETGAAPLNMLDTNKCGMLLPVTIQISLPTPAR